MTCTKPAKVSKEWDFVSRGTELSRETSCLNTSLLSRPENSGGIVSDEDAAEVWAAAREETINQTERVKQGQGEWSHSFSMRRKWSEPSTREQSETYRSTLT
jgi:hypothetical protein